MIYPIPAMIWNPRTEPWSLQLFKLNFVASPGLFLEERSLGALTHDWTHNKQAINRLDHLAPVTFPFVSRRRPSGSWNFWDVVRIHKLEIVRGFPPWSMVILNRESRDLSLFLSPGNHMKWFVSSGDHQISYVNPFPRLTPCAATRPLLSSIPKFIMCLGSLIDSRVFER